MNHPPETQENHDTRWRVSRCECGIFHIKLGNVVLEMDHVEFLNLQELVTQASDYFGLTRTPTPPATLSRAH